MQLVRPAVVLATLSLAGCFGPDAPEGVALSADEIAERTRNARAEPLDVKGRSQLVSRLDSTLNQWFGAQFSSRTAADRALAENLAEVLHATVYKHYPDVLEFLLHGDDYQKTVAAAAIGFMRPAPLTNPNSYRESAQSTEYKAAIDPLVDLLAHPDPKIVQNALLGLWRLRDPETPIEPILDLLSTSPVADVRANSALALTSILTQERADDAIDVLLTATNDRSPRVRVHAITALGASKHPSAAGRLLKLLDDPYELIQANAARAIAALGDKKNAGALVMRLAQLDADTPTGKFRKPMDLDRRRDLLRGYLIESLQILSGETYGDDIEAWDDWWVDELESRDA